MKSHPRPTLTPRAEALLTTGAVHVTHAVGLTVRAIVDGTDRTHDVRRDPDGWSCTCPSWTYRHRCAHVAAVQAATVPAEARQTQPSDLPKHTPHLTPGPVVTP